MSAMTMPPTSAGTLGRRYSHLLTFMVERERKLLEQTMGRQRKSASNAADCKQPEASKKETDRK
jgi:hypothetical protein